MDGKGKEGKERKEREKRRRGVEDEEEVGDDGEQGQGLMRLTHGERESTVLRTSTQKVRE